MDPKIELEHLGALNNFFALGKLEKSLQKKFVQIFSISWSKFTIGFGFLVLVDTLIVRISTFVGHDSP